MSWITPVRLIIFAFLLMLVGIILPFLMVIKVIEPTFFLSFLSYGSSLAGMVLGIVGVAFYVSFIRRK